MDKKLIKKFITNQCTNDELDTIVEWFRDPNKTAEAGRLFQEIWEETKPVEKMRSVDYDNILENIHDDIEILRATDDGFISGSPAIQKKYTYRFLNVIIRIVAVLFIPLLISSLYMFIRFGDAFTSEKDQISDLYTKVTSPMGSISCMQLPDGSLVWLNHGSTLQFPQRFSGRTRTVKLIGEGYFKVMPDKKKPFIVELGDIQALVKGTEFNIMAYPEDDAIETTLKSGRLVLQQKTAQNTFHQIFDMVPGQHVEYLKEDHKIRHSSHHVNKYTSWKDGKLIFINDPFDEIVKKLSRWYNLDIQLEDEELYQYTYTATFIDETLPQVLELLKIATPIKYSISSREKTPDGTFTKRKILIQLE